MAARDKVRSRATGTVVTTENPEALPPVLRMLTDPRTQDEVAKALPPGLEVERFLRVARTAVQANPALLGCTPRSIIAAIHKAASYGLDVGPVGQAYLVPYRDTAQLIIGYRGMIALARRSGELASIEAREVKENDEFEFEYGLHPRLRHVPALNDRGKLVCFYGIAQFLNGGSYMIVVDLDTIEEHRRQSPTGNRPDGPWQTNYDAMGRKTVIRIMEPYLPLTTEAAEAIAGDDAIPVETATVIDTTGEPRRPEPEPEPAPVYDDEPDPDEP
jgi:recombination protein RecT